MNQYGETCAQSSQSNTRFFPYLASSTGRIFSHIAQLGTLAWKLLKFTRGCATEVFPHELSNYKNPSNMAKNVPFAKKEHSMQTTLRENIIGSPSRKKSLVCQPTEPFADKVRQDLLSGCIQLRPMLCLTILSPLRTIIVCLKSFYNLVSLTL